jgi:predicted secreted protein
MGISAFGTLLKIGDGNNNFTTISEVREITPPPLSADTADTTHHSSTSGYEEAVVTVLRTGEPTFTINYDPTDDTHDAANGLLQDYENKTLRNFQVVFTDTNNTTWDFSAYVTGFEPSAPHDDALTADVTLKVSGEPDLRET